MDIKVIKTDHPAQKPTDESKIGFCKTFCDHMFIAEYDEGQGWHDARVQPYTKFSIDPASPLLHYGQEIFEGMKAYRYANGEIGLFRPMDNFERMNRSADRMCIPEIPVDMQMDGLLTLLDLDRDWVPHEGGNSLYIRPTCIADGQTLGAAAASRYYYYIIAAPAGALHGDGLTPVNIYIEDNYVRAVKGGTGYVKTGGNYAGSLKAAKIANSKGFSDVLWLDAKENRYVEEVGAMNMMFVIDGVLTTPSLQGSILPGITRNSVLTLARDMGMKVEERRIDVAELIEASKAGVLNESFATGTAAVVMPVGMLQYKDEVMNMGKTAGPVATKLHKMLTDIQWGRAEDTYGWTKVVPHK